MNSQTDITIVGHTTHDRYGGGFVAGGCAYYGARVYRELVGGVDSADVQLLTAAGEDFVCEGALEDIEHTLVRKGETTTFQNLYPEGRPRLQILEAQAPPMTPEMFEDRLWEGADVVHLAPVLREIDLETWKDAVDPELLAISVQGWIKRGGPRVQPADLEEAGVDDAAIVPEGARRVVQEPWDVDVETLGGVDVACLSDEDLIGQGDLLERLVEAVPVVALTHGADGASVYVDGDETRVGAYDTEAVDPTGAGDTFAAGFVWRLARGDSPVEAARFGAACASIVVEGTGGACLGRLDEARGRVAGVVIRDS